MGFWAHLDRRAIFERGDVYRVGFDAPRLPEFGQGELNREDRGLGDLRSMHLGGLLRAAEFREQGKAGPRAHRRLAPLNAFRSCVDGDQIFFQDHLHRRMRQHQLA